YEIQKKILGVKDTGYTGDFGLQELVKRSEDLMINASVVKEREIMDRFFSELQKAGKVAYGFVEVNKALELGAVDTILISEGFDWMHAKLKCENCGLEIEKDLPKDKVEAQVCEKCGKLVKIIESKELIDVLVEKAKSIGTRVEFISVDTGEGVQFKELGGIGAFLRYKIS
ncbi:MAG TPA: peptide chain release factor 1, partial [archaeon]|nr:peptide chain release factor 1 [archaeon]